MLMGYRICLYDLVALSACILCLSGQINAADGPSQSLGEAASFQGAGQLPTWFDDSNDPPTQSNLVLGALADEPAGFSNVAFGHSSENGQVPPAERPVSSWQRQTFATDPQTLFNGPARGEPGSFDAGLQSSLRTSDNDDQTVVGFEFVFVRPFHDRDFGIFRTDSGGAFEGTAYDVGLSTTPRIWIGKTDEDGRGYRIEYWQYNHSGDPISDTVPAGGVLDGSVLLSSIIAGDVMTASRDLQLHTLDIDAVQEFHWNHFELTGKAGVAVVWVDQTHRESLTGLAPDAALLEHDFVGVGPTIAFDARRWTQQEKARAFFAAFRGRLLYGWNEREVTVDSVGTSLRKQDEVIASVGLQIGSEWRLGENIGLDWDFLLRVAYEAQYWHGIGMDMDNRASLGFHGFHVGFGTWW